MSNENDQKGESSAEAGPGAPDGANVQEPAGAAPALEELVERPKLAEQIKRHLNYSVLGLSFLAVPVGVVAAYGANGFRLAFGLLGEWLHVEGGLPDGVWQWIGLAAGGLLFGIVLAVFKWEGFRSPAHVIVAANEQDGKLTLKSGIITAAADAISLGLGAAVGRYGPAVQLGATIGSQMGQWIGLTRTGLRVLLGCGVAGAISASFNAPIAGAIFAHEVIIGHFRLRAFAPITLASVSAVAVTRFHSFQYIALKVADERRTLELQDYPLFLLIGVLGACVAMLYMGGITGLRFLSKRFHIPTVLQPLIGGTIAGAVGLSLPLVLGLGDNTLHLVLGQGADAPAFGFQMLLLLLAGKLLASVACLGLKYPGGAFSPAIFTGAMLGGAAGLAIPGLDYQICVLVGMGAMVSSVVGAPIATILIVFELTENYEAATAVMVGVVAANGIVTRFFARSLFHRQIRQWGIDLDRPREQRLMECETVEEIMSQGILTVRPDRTAGELRKLVDRGHRGDVYVADKDRRLIGKLPLAALASAEDHETARQLSVPAVHWLHGDDDLWSAFVKIEDFIGYSIPVVDDSENMHIIGVVFESDFIRSYREKVAQVRNETR